MGYTPVFDSVFTGTLCGKWPDTGIWVCLLAMADRDGVIDKTPQYISAVVGISVDELVACIDRFLQPDPHSRSDEEDGRRLVRLEDGRLWGWRIVNHAKYREKARLQSKNHTAVASGAEAERKRVNRGTFDRPPLSADVRRSPPDSASHTQTETKTQTREETTAAARPDDRFEAFRALFPSRSGNQPWSRAFKAIRARLQEGHSWPEIFDGVERYAAWCKATGKLGTEMVMQAATFCGPDKAFTRPWTLPATKADARLAGNLSAADEFLRRTEAQ